MSRRGEGESAGPLELLDGAFWLVRRAGVAAWVCYYLGALPFVLGVLYFWADMSRSAYAAEHCLGGSLALAGLFVWMKSWQGVYAGKLWRRLAGQDERPWTLRRAMGIAASQGAVQPLGLYVLPLASVLVLPVGWVYAFYQSATALADGPEGGPRGLTARAARQAALWPKQNHAMLLLALLVSLLVWVNSLAAIALLPSLAQTLLGVEWSPTRLSLWWMNSTSLAMATALTYLAVDPLLKAAYVIRCFHGESLQTGTDLRAELKRLAAIRKAGGVVAGAVVMLCVGTGASAGQTAESLRIAECGLRISCAASVAVVEAEAAPKAPQGRQGAAAKADAAAKAGAGPQAAAVPRRAGELDRAAEDVLSRPRYAWRAPAEKQARERGTVGQFLEDVFEYIAKFFRWVRETVGTFLDRMFRPRASGADGERGGGLLASPQFWLMVLAGIVAAGVAVGAWYLWRRRKDRPVLATVEALAAAPDVSDEDVGAERLPEDGWASLARELLGKGELRLALRAMYLGTLALLAQRELIALARHKSNRDYQGELARRGAARPELTETFGSNVRMFEDAWYGMHEVTGAMLEQFGANAERMRGDGRA